VTWVSDYDQVSRRHLRSVGRGIALRAQISLRATDVDWSSGSGPEVAGPDDLAHPRYVRPSTRPGDLSDDGVSTFGSQL
jgi:hypothetical protein